MNDRASIPTQHTLGDSLEGFDKLSFHDHGYAARKRIDFLKLPLIAQGAEGWILDGSTYISGQAIKLFKPPAMTSMTEQAEQKWDEYPRKLKELEKLKLPTCAVRPTHLIHSKTPTSAVVGYFMPMIDGISLSSLTSRSGQKANRYTKNDLMQIFSDLITATEAVHQAGALICDFKPHNILLKRNKPHIIDIESIEFGDFKFHGFTQDYLDPLICDPTLNYVEKKLPYNLSCDGYALEVMLFECLAGIHPFSGVHEPTRGGAPIDDSARSLRGVSVLNHEVGVPDFIEPFHLIPNTLLQHFLETFEHHQRNPLSHQDLAYRWKACTVNSYEHVGDSCPTCMTENQRSEIKRGASARHPIKIERSNGEGIPAALGYSVKTNTPLMARVIPKESGVQLTLNRVLIAENVAENCSVISLPDENTAYLADGCNVRLVTPQRSLPLVLETIQADPYGAPLFAATDRYLAYIDVAGNIVLSSPHKIQEGIRYSTRFKNVTHLAMGKQVISVATEEFVAILHIDPTNQKLIIEKVPLPQSAKITTLQVHPRNSQTLLLYRSKNSKNYDVRVYGIDGASQLAISSNKETNCWFSQRSDGNKTFLVYWQDEKLCEAALDQSTQKLKQIWGINNVSRPDTGSFPVVVNEKIYLMINGEIVRMKLL